jgi:hypothetical protein
VPVRGYIVQRRDASHSDLFVWCPEHKVWDVHGCVADETPGKLTGRVAHHGECDSNLIMVIGEADWHVKKIRQQYSRSTTKCRNKPPLDHPDWILIPISRVDKESA